MLSAVVALSLAAFIGWNLGRDEAARAPAELEDYLFWQARPLAEFRLAAAGNRSVGLADLKGKWTFVFVGYTHCPDVCPLTLSDLALAFAALDKSPGIAPEIRAMFVSVDPRRDTPELLRAYTAHFNPAFLGVTGSTAEVDAFVRQLGALYTIHAPAAGKPADSYTVSHTSTIFLVDPLGRLYARFPDPHTPQEIAEVFLKVRAFHRGKTG